MKKNNDLLFVIFLLFMSLNLSGDNEKKIRVNLCKISMPEVVIQFAKSANAHTVQIYSSFLVKKCIINPTEIAIIIPAAILEVTTDFIP